MFFGRKFWFWKFDLIWPSLTLYQRFLGSNIKINATIVFCVPNDSYNLCRTTVGQYFHLVTFLTWPWAWPLLTIRSLLIRFLLLRLKSLLAKFGFAAVICPVSVAGKAKSDGFDLWPDLDLAWDLLKKIFEISLKSTRSELSIAASQASLRLLVRELAGRGGGQGLPPPPVGRVRPETPVGRGWPVTRVGDW